MKPYSHQKPAICAATMAMYDVSPQRDSLLGDATSLALLPQELLHIVQDKNASNILDALAAAALTPRLTGPLFAHFEPVFADICARWVLKSQLRVRDDSVIAAFARILPFSPGLSVFLDEFLQRRHDQDGEISGISRILPSRAGEMSTDPAEDELVPVLLAMWRLVNFSHETYSRLVPPDLQRLFQHPSLVVRHLAIRLYCQLYSASDYKLDILLQRFIQTEEPLLADFDGNKADYHFLTLFEHRRARDLHDLLLSARSRAKAAYHSSPCLQPLTPLVVSWGRTIVPRVSGPASGSSTLIKAPTTLKNLEAIASLLQKDGPILLRGLPGSGKTSLVQEVARELGQASGMVTLHLNQQTDAKVLIGLYTTGSRPGSFEWRPGILAKAVQEGRWLLIEDLDRAPNEVISTLLPLIERRELLVPSRNETIKAPPGFRIFATMRTSLGMNGHEATRAILGERFWQPVSVEMLPQEELEEIIQATFPSLDRLIPDLLAVYGQVSSFSRAPSALLGGRGVGDRPINVRDLMKWCRRLEQTLKKSSKASGDGVLTNNLLLSTFLDAMDCFVGSVKETSTRLMCAEKIAQGLRISPESLDHALRARMPQLVDEDRQLTVGRGSMRKQRQPHRLPHSRKPFAPTTHARRLLEQISVAVDMREPVLLVGETGIGKTAVVQQLADLLGHKLVAINLSQQSEVGDLLGGFKPVNVRSLAMPLKEEFEDLFAATEISTKTNQKYLSRIATCFAKGKWAEASKLWQQAPKIFEQILQQLADKQNDAGTQNGIGGQPAKRRKTRLQVLLDLKPRWAAFAQSLQHFDMQLSGGSGRFAFSFVEGKIVKAVRNGEWVLLDEVNLASADTLESIADLLTTGPGDVPSILLSETGELERVKAHPDFRIFAAMNPATDVGKRDLPIGLRSRFTEIYVGSPDKDSKDLALIVETCLKGNNSLVRQAANRVVSLYLEIKGLADEKRLVDGANEVPHFSLRTLTRVLAYVNEVSPYYGLDRALFEGFCMGFLTLLSQKSENAVMPSILSHTFGDGLNRRQSLLSQPPKHPNDGREYVRFMNKDKDRQYWLVRGEQAPKERLDYIRTPYVERNLLNLVRATSTRRFPILIQGPTSAGKTSMIEYLADFSGHKFVRINNHEHTDLQEYLGTYISGLDGKLKFQEGALVQAMRNGHWIVLDELNLAPTDVLEALNRLLDDNRELLIPETQEVVRPHENFMLFATQNPPGAYGGRKVLSRAFRNRFLELHFDDIPESELGYILQKRCPNTAPSDCERIVTVYKELSRLRQTSRVFEQKNSFATLRDLFRWALRDAENREQIACNGFMLLAERVRDEGERIAVKGIIETVFKVKIDPEALYDANRSSALKQFQALRNSHGVVLTKAMCRLYVLVSEALRNNEPILLVGETGCGKTTVCQLLAEAQQKELSIVNAHQNTETGDIIGSQRPVRNRGAIVESLKRDLAEVLTFLGHSAEGSVEELLERYNGLQPDELARLEDDGKQRITTNQTRSKALFEWCDGSLVHAMKGGQYFLLDEISLADDSVLERLNSVLEPQRMLLLAEKGVEDASVQALEGFQFFATMNPGGDFGKKELSPALRNRFTEIWVPPLSEGEDIRSIVVAKLAPRFKPLADKIVQFSHWFGKTFRSSAATPFSIRDILVWVDFINHCDSKSPVFAMVHGAATVFIDTLGANPSAMIALDPKALNYQRAECLNKLGSLLGDGADASSIYTAEPNITIGDDFLWVGEFAVQRTSVGDMDNSFEFEAPTTKLNAMRIVRALKLGKPILLEGNPGVGKTTLVSALSRASGNPLTRINLSDQTDLMDLFGTDVPVEGADAGCFAWRDAPFLQAMQKGEWVLLDEMNLASQSVLEGLNACLDHRGEVYIAELDRVFKRHPGFRLFAAQNPHHQGGGRKGLPSSFVNRFIVVYADVFTEDDQMRIAQRRSRGVDPASVRDIIKFMSTLEHEVVTRRSFGAEGSPWEFNLRDTLRWLELASSPNPLIACAQVKDFLDIVIRQRFRTRRDREQVTRLFSECFQVQYEGHDLYCATSSLFSQVGFGLLRRNLLSQPTLPPRIDQSNRLAELESLLICVQQDLPCILSGPPGSGKSTLLHHLAALAGKKLVVFSLNADVDTLDLVGGFEQADPMRQVNSTLEDLRGALGSYILDLIPREAPEEMTRLLETLCHCRGNPERTGLVIRGIEKLAPDIPASSHLATILERTIDTLRKPLTLENPRFEWLDGIIVRAVEAGEWLVLDNANLCSASVLDRLNSLLERPDGLLSINEHSGPDGEPRVIRPHPDFRVFLTMDPKYGELSRAMRNRSVEICLDVPETEVEMFVRRIAPVEASMQRYYEVLGMGTSGFTPLALDNLSLADARLLVNFSKSADRGLLRACNPADAQAIEATVSYVKSQDAQELRQAIMQNYVRLSELISTTTGACNWEQNWLDEFTKMQPFHPLQNSVVVPTLRTHTTSLPDWISFCYESYAELYSAHQAMQSQQQRANIAKPSALNRLQRSFVAPQIASVRGDSTIQVGQFLSQVLQTIHSFLTAHLGDHQSSQLRRSVLLKLFHVWWRTFSFASHMDFDEVKFQAHLGQGIKLLEADQSAAAEDASGTVVSEVLHRLQTEFVAGFKLSTGLSIETLWPLLRPSPIPDEAAFEHVQDMERLAHRFDKLRWRISASASDLGKIMSSLAKAYGVMRKNGADSSSLLQALAHEIQALEDKKDSTSTYQPPLLSDEFEFLRQVQVFHSDSREIEEEQYGILVLSNLPTQAQMRLQSCSGIGARLQAVDYLLCQDSSTHPWTGTLVSSLLRKYDSISSATLLSLRSLESELPFMGQMFSRSSRPILSNSIDKLNEMLWDLLVEVIASHGPSLRSDLKSIYDLVSHHVQTASVEISEKGVIIQPPLALPVTLDLWPEHLVDVMNEHFSIAVSALVASNLQMAPRKSFTAIAWVQFAVGCIKLYTPDKVSDPYLKSLMERDFHDTLLQSLEKKLSALRDFSDVASSLRTNLVKGDIEALGVDPPEMASLVYRPPGAGLSRIQKETFNPVLDFVAKDKISTTQYRLLSSSSEEMSQEIDLLKNNVHRLIERLSARFTAYQDLTVPLVGLLRCLQLGLSLTESHITSNSSSADNTHLLGVTPFLGGRLISIEDAAIPIQSLDFLQFLSACISIDGIKGLSSKSRKLMFACFHFFSEEWSKKLEADRRAEDAKNSIYRFRGSAEDEEEVDEKEFNELFPDYEAETPDQQPTKPPQHSARDLTVRLAEIHKDIVHSPRSPSSALVDLCKLTARKIASGATEGLKSEINLDELLLPAATLVLEDKLASLKASTLNSGYNFYVDPNLPEARKLVGLVYDIQARFRSLQQVDEISHLQPIADVLDASDRVLELSYSEPLARIIPRVEKLHAFLYEWQFRGYASRQHTAPALYDAATATIVSWRKLELSTWSKLFDMEAQKCREDAGSWWFIAYQAAVAGPLTMLESNQELKTHSVQLLEQLTNYLRNSMVGQFSARLDLLRQIQAHLDLLVLDHPAISVIRNALHNFVAFYSRYELKATEAIKNGRESLQKKMNDVLLLASWRDTNIAALRESARKSHQKLFRLVRKFRSVLGQPMGALLAQEVPATEAPESNDVLSGIASPSPAIDPSAAEICRRLVPTWGSDAQSSRLSNPEKIIRTMENMSRLPDMVVPATEIVDGYVSDLVASIKALRDETPGILTEENTNLVKHLKNRKTKLFNDTMKDIRLMGFKRNLGENSLASQKSLPTVFARLGIVQAPAESDFTAVESYFHKLVDMAPRFRTAIYEHHNDVNRESINRGAGYLEGILSVAVQQQEVLVDTTHQFEHLQSKISSVKSLGENQQGGAICVEKSRANHDRALRWLIEILKFAIHLVDAHAHMGSIDNQAIRSRLQGWVDKVAALSRNLEATPKLPAGITSVARLELEAQAEETLHRMRLSLEQNACERPDLSFILNQVKLWTSTSYLDTQLDERKDGLETYFEKMLTISKKVLDGIQKFHKSVLAFPSSVEDASWLVQYGTALSAAIKSLHMKTIISDMSLWIESLKTVNLENGQINEAARALTRVCLPIVQQYAAVCQDSILQLADLHRSTCRLGYHLSKSFTEIASKGFCTPPEKSEDKKGESGELESGTGLGDGEGAQDISKDVEPDEDLSELAQEQNKERSGEVEAEEDAVDMGDNDFEGEMGSADGEEDGDGSQGEREGQDDLDEEAGDVDDLDPTAVDEKMWDGDGEEADKDQQGNKPMGKKSEGQAEAADDNQLEDQAGNDEVDEEMGPEQEDVLPQEELDRQDQHVQENEVLDLPEDMDIDAAGESSEDDALDDLSNMDQEEDQTAPNADGENDNAADDNISLHERRLADDADSVVSDNDEEVQAKGEAEMNLDNEEAGEDDQKPTQEERRASPEKQDSIWADQDAAQSEMPSGGGQTEEQNANKEDDRDAATAESKAQCEEGQLGEQPRDEEDSTSGNNGSTSKPDGDPPQAEQDASSASVEQQPLKKLGDVLERWHKNQRDIKAAENNQQNNSSDIEVGWKEFQHLQDENAPADTQALGTATNDEAKPLDESMAIDNEMEEEPQTHILPDDEPQAEDDQPDKMDLTETDEAGESKTKTEESERRSGVTTKQGAYDRETSPQPPARERSEDKDSEDSAVQETSTQLSATHITSEGDRTMRDYSECMQQWLHYQTKTHALSLSLTSQLRLILTPSQSTKLSGSFRTGKRLNIKKIIPYIASSYKRDKIWMRRSIPTKRAYQILLCVDDSQSMGSTRSGQLALESLVMVARALGMLEAGQVGVVGFGADVFTAHGLADDPPLASSPAAGARVLQHFSFAQRSTDVGLLVRSTIDHFRRARLLNPAGAGGEDLWQLSLILSDGITPSRSHDTIRRLLREAAELRIMIVFIIMDDASDQLPHPTATSSAAAAAAAGPARNSVLELKEARYLKDEDRFVIEPYLDSFPFPYYLIVHDLEDLPGALAGLLRTWFAEVNA